MDAVFRALGDPSRRLLLDTLFEEDGRSLSQLEARLPAMTRFGVMKHLKVLEEAGLVTSRKVGREKLHYLNPVPIQLLTDRWISKYAAPWTRVMSDIKRALEEDPMGATMTETAPAKAGPTHVFEVYIKATPERIWQAITESSFTEDYYYASTVESDWKPGSPYRYTIGDDIAIVGEVLEADPPRSLVCTFDARWDPDVAGDPPSRIAWTIEPMGDICRVEVVHDGFVGDTNTAHAVSGTSYILSGLKTLLETGQPLHSGS